MEKAEQKVYIRMMGKFAIEVEGSVHQELMTLSPKGLSLLELLILEENQPVRYDMLIEQLWAGEMAVQHAETQEQFLHRAKTRLKTLVCRTREYLNALSPMLGNCVITLRGSYTWQKLPGVETDADEIRRLCDAIIGSPFFDVEQWSLAEKLIRLYGTGLYLTGDWAGGPQKSLALHERYLHAVLCYLTSLERRSQYLKLYRVAGGELKKDPEHPDLLRMQRVAAAMLKNRGVSLPEEAGVVNRVEMKSQVKEREVLPDERADVLRSLPIVEKVTAKKVIFTQKFKDYFAQEYEKGVSAWDILRASGVDPELIGWGRIIGLCSMARRVIRLKQTGKEAAPGIDPYGMNSIRMSRRIAELEDEIAYLNRKLEVLERKKTIQENGESVLHSAGGR